MPVCVQVVCADGTIMTSSYEEGGECVRLAYSKFVKSENDVDEGRSSAGGDSYGNTAPPAPLIGQAVAVGNNAVTGGSGQQQGQGEY